MSSSRLSKTAESPISQIIRRESYLEKELQVCDRDHRLPGLGGAIFNSGVLIEVFAVQFRRESEVRPTAKRGTISTCSGRRHSR